MCPPGSLFFARHAPLWRGPTRLPRCLRPGRCPRAPTTNAALSSRDRYPDAAALRQGQTWVILKGSEIISTWTKREPRLKLKADTRRCAAWTKLLSGGQKLPHQVLSPLLYKPLKAYFIEMVKQASILLFKTRIKIKYQLTKSLVLHLAHCLQRSDFFLMLNSFPFPQHQC